MPAKNWLIMKNGDHVIGLFHGMFEKNILTFNPGWDSNAQKLPAFTDVRELQRQLKAQGVKMQTEADEATTRTGQLHRRGPRREPDPLRSARLTAVRTNHRDARVTEFPHPRCTISLEGTRKLPSASRQARPGGQKRNPGEGETIMNPNQALWEKGDFTRIADFMRQSGEEVIQSLEITPPLRALDLGCGDGTTAVPLALAGADVTGIDISRNLVAAGNNRAEQAGLDRLKFHHGDACNLEGVEDRSFDLTLSVFGAMFAPKPHDVAREMVRVTKPGGCIVMGNWIPNDPTFVSQLLQVSSAFTPPPPQGFISPMTWGVETHVYDRFAQAGVPREQISLATDTFYFTSADKSPEQFIDLFRLFYGPTMNAFEAAEKNGKADELHSRLVGLAKSQNRSANGGTFIPATFLRVTVSV